MTSIIMTGAAGNTGSRVLRRLLRKDAISEAVVLLRTQDLDADLALDPRVRSVRADLHDVAKWGEGVTSDHIFVEVANIRIADQMLPYISDLGIRRAFCVTTTGMFSRYQSYSGLYKTIEASFSESPLDITVLRPTMIYGNSRDKNMHKLISFLRRSPLFPLFGGGANLMQPVQVDDLAWAISESVIRDAHGEFNLGGPTALSYRQIVETVVNLLDTKVALVPVPHGLAASMAGILQHIPGFPVSREQVLRLLEDKAFDISQAQDTLGYRPMDFETGIGREIIELRSQKEDYSIA